jgi:hypothetical protein
VSVSVLPEEELLRFRFNEVMFDSLAFQYVVMLLNYNSMLLVVVVSLVML